jgi:putative addiction module antidote
MERGDAANRPFHGFRELALHRAAPIMEASGKGSQMVELKVRKIGKSLGIVLPQDVLNRLRTADGERLFLVEAPDGAYLLTSDDSLFAKKMATAADIMARYRNTLRALSK